MERSSGPSLTRGCVAPRARSGDPAPPAPLPARHPLHALRAYRAPATDGHSVTVGPGRASPAPIATVRAFHVPYAGEFLGAAIQALCPVRGLRPEDLGSALSGCH